MDRQVISTAPEKRFGARLVDRMALAFARPRRRRTGRGLAMLVTVTLLAAALPALVLPATSAFAATPMACDGSTVYIQDGSGNVRSFNSQTRTLAGSNTLTGQKGNGLG